MPKTKSRGNGEGTIYYSETHKLWVSQITLNNGKRKTVYGKTRKAVKDKMLKIQNDIALGRLADQSHKTVAELLKNLIDEDRALNVLNDNSYLRKKETLKRIEQKDIGSMEIQKVTESDVLSFLKTITDSSDSVISKIFALLNRCFKEAVRKEIIIKNPMDGVRKPKSTKKNVKVRALTVSEQKALINILSEKNINYKEQLLLMLYTGMRMGEINALDVKDVNLTFKTITVRRSVTRDSNEHTVIGETTKTYAGMRTIPLSKPAVDLLADYLKTYAPNSESLLFYDYRARKVITTSQVNMTLCRVLKKYSIIDDTVAGKVSLHSLRHTYATRCIESGMPAKVLQMLLGHTDIKTTLNTYCDAFDSFKQEHIANATEYLERNGLIC
ncbi:MAG TPA: site-specific integrase [Candidatus Eubacterium faecipullorum]|uniref:Site-specific integrase n=1 Tax=Candidatus Eubacterium faecipullorum TaxID=2838571 RepID=A0A9D1RFA0_9FIRM|nr:site-specific integrase [Candidatus Eubacterium faecipullorum]